ncbi:tetratricopeptide repeat protein [Caulobacter sp. UNC279MFTsu5.1]|uniref:tetratricopeptide repeat protein n=1 Tax=Caulobacter sp. UNC279MFTsu5.1 TaxID=1502775 RepID=UPI0003A3830C|nr:tetratricopeptide repeat protein [Caulobacter sp. UNC279MFTsu5.1]SFJ71568.1 Flp pilus assembly protein TadD, contains TPR repeats [Caulobacter sp. UNC279MFTsu5.1]
MCRKRARLATVLVPLLASGVLTAASAYAADKPAAATAPVAAPEPPRKATPAERAEMRRADPLTRMAFWSTEAERDGRDVEAGVGLAQALRALGRYDEAADAAGRILIVVPDNYDALMESARANVARGQGFYAIEPGRKAAALQPRDWRPLSLLGVAYEQAKRDDEALAAHRQAVALAPAEAVPLTNLAMHLASSGDLPGAEKLLRQAAALPTATIQVRQNLALVVGLQGRLDEAEKLARQDLPPESVDNNLAWLRAAVGQASATRSWDAVKAGG